MGRAARLLRIHLLGIVAYVALFYFFTGIFGLIGPGIAAIATTLLTLSLTALLVARIG
jgi:hypothetical protein